MRIVRIEILVDHAVKGDGNEPIGRECNFEEVCMF